MSAGPLTEYNGTSGVADNGGNALVVDLNVYYSVRRRLSAGYPAFIVYGLNI